MSTSMAPREPQVGLIIREREPVNLEYPFDQLHEFLTPNDLFYIRSHFKAPVLDRHEYKLTIGGAVQEPFTISYEDLLAMPSVTKPATLELCRQRSHLPCAASEGRAMAAWGREYGRMDRRTS